jgi:prepilin signal peptidase PulO-like enzyme (type II secretory pathway)
MVTESFGAVGISNSLGGAALCFSITLCAYCMSGGGAGDVKLATALGALLGIKLGVFAVAYSYVAAAAAMLAWTAWTNGPWTLLSAFGRKVGAIFFPFWILPPNTDEQALLVQPVPLAPYFAIGTLLAVIEASM